MDAVLKGAIGCGIFEIFATNLRVVLLCNPPALDEKLAGGWPRR